MDQKYNREYRRRWGGKKATEKDGTKEELFSHNCRNITMLCWSTELHCSCLFVRGFDKLMIESARLPGKKKKGKKAFPFNQNIIRRPRWWLPPAFNLSHWSSPLKGLPVLLGWGWGMCHATNRYDHTPRSLHTAPIASYILRGQDRGCLQLRHAVGVL